MLKSVFIRCYKFLHYQYIVIFQIIQVECVLCSNNCEQIRLWDAVSNDFFFFGVTFFGYHVSVLVNI